MEGKLSELNSVALGAMSAVLVVGIALAWIEGQWGALSGRPGQLAEVSNKIIYLAVCGLLVTGAAGLSGALWGLLAGGKDSASGLAHSLAQIGMLVVDVVLVAISSLVTLGILSGAVAGQFLVTLGHAHGWSEARARLAGAIVFGLGGLCTIPIAHFVVSAVAGG